MPPPVPRWVNVTYWIVTILFCLMMILGGITEIMTNEEGVAMFNALGLTPKLLPFIGAAKILGVIALLIPGFPRIREWAYAGFVFDFIGAAYLWISVGNPGEAGGPIVGLVLCLLSYWLYRKRFHAQNPTYGIVR